MLVGVDTGGTFTDLVGSDGLIRKIPSTPDNPARAVAAAVDSVAGGVAPARLAHGTTVATNALLERKGAVVALVTTAGHEDVLEIARQDRPSLYDAFVDRPEPLVARPHRFGVPGRLGSDGSEVEPLDVSRIPALPTGVGAVAVCLLHADLDDRHERAVAAVLRERGHDVTCSTEVSPEFREYERAVTTTVNASLRPVCRAYLQGIAGLAEEVLVLSSAGGLLPVDVAADLPVALLLSGPAGGVRAAAEVAAVNGFDECVTFDMGGTSTDVCLVRGGLPEAAPGREVGGFPIRLPSLDVHTIGAGGGSIARIDPGGALAVGPRSAGAVPGPACYGRGGTAPTVTDADIVLGRIPADAPFPGIGHLDVSAAVAACAAAGVDAAGIVAVVDAAMEGAIRRVTVERGVDPRGLALVAFGGAGPLHACALADALGMTAVIVPPRAGVLSAAGILAAPVERELVLSWAQPADHTGIEEARETLAAAALAAVGAAPGAVVGTTLDCRYAGQSHELTVASVAAFGAEHLRRNGHERPGDVVEVVAVRARASVPSPVSVLDLPAPEREVGVGPCVLAEPDCTIWVPPGWRAERGAAGALVLRRTGPWPVTHDRRGDPVALDPATLAVLLARLSAVAEEMLAVLRRSAFSPNIKERADCSTALFTADGELLAQSESIPVHLGSMPASVAAAIAAVGDPGAGHQVVLNDPFAGGTHLNDVTVVAPVHVGGTLVGWVANRAHHADIGGAAPGSIPADATHIAEEGIRLPPVRLTDEVRAVFLAASRTPHERAGDLDAQVGANRLGVERLVELAEQGWLFAEVLDYGERRMRSALAALPDGTWRFTDQVDSTGAGAGQREPATITVVVTVAGDEVTFDFTGTAPQSAGNVNAVEAVTVSAVAFALRSASDPTIPPNGGAMRPVRVVAPPGTLVAATFPAAVGAGNVEVSQRIADVCLGALAQVAPERVGAASQGTMNNLLIGGDGWVYYETLAGGQGGRPARRPPFSSAKEPFSGPLTLENGGGEPPRRGQSGIHTGMTNTRNTPVEALERAYPLRVLRYRLRHGSGGAGLAPGGEGIERDVQVLEDCTVSLITERRVSQPWGLAGGEPGAVGENWLLPGGDEARAERLPDKCSVRLATGDVVRMLTPGGGGWGTPP